MQHGAATARPRSSSSIHVCLASGAIGLPGDERGAVEVCQRSWLEAGLTGHPFCDICGLDWRDVCRFEWDGVGDYPWWEPRICHECSKDLRAAASTLMRLPASLVDVMFDFVGLQVTTVTANTPVNGWDKVNMSDSDEYARRCALTRLETIMLLNHGIPLCEVKVKLTYAYECYDCDSATMEDIRKINDFVKVMQTLGVMPVL
jgi:hypothetical protein